MLNRAINRWCNKLMASRDPDVVIGDPENPYLLRWWVFPRNRWLNLYLHRVLRSDDDRALHDHPWINMSYIVDGAYNEVTPISFINNRTGSMIDGIKRTLRKQGTFKFRLPTAQHRLELLEGKEAAGWGFNVEMQDVLRPCTTLFLTGPRVRIWGFHCPKGWVKWTDFTAKTPEGTFVAKGCGDIDPALLAPRPAKSGWWPKSPEGLGTPSKGPTPTDTASRYRPVNRSS